MCMCSHTVTVLRAAVVHVCTIARALPCVCLHAPGYSADAGFVLLVHFLSYGMTDTCVSYHTLGESPSKYRSLDWAKKYLWI